MSSGLEFIRNLDIDPKMTDKHKNENIGMILCYSDDVTSQGKSDVLNSVQLAQLAANVKYDQYKERDQWYQFYVMVLSKIGWNIENFHFKTYQTSSQELSVTSAIISTADACLTKDQVAVIQKNLDSLKTPENENSSSDSGSVNVPGYFRATFFWESSSGQVKMFMVVFDCTVSTEANWMWRVYKVADMNPTIGKQIATLNEEVFSKLRQAITDKLGEEAKKIIGDLPI